MSGLAEEDLLSTTEKAMKDVGHAIVSAWAIFVS